MTQSALIRSKLHCFEITLPDANEQVLPGVRWGAVDAFPTPAYWHYLVLTNRLLAAPAKYKLGKTLAEEVGACLLGGHGIPASVGLVAYEKLRKMGAFSGSVPDESQLFAWLSEPMIISGKSIRYRFPAQKAKYLAMALQALQESPEVESGKQLRDWLIKLPGIGPKTGSWIARNWLCSDEVAILDIHIMRFGQAIGLFDHRMTVERNYYELEERFLQFCDAIDVRASELDAVVWFEMASSPMTVKLLDAQLLRTSTRESFGAKQRHSHSRQASLVG
jgi:N-glycosylase/DNA lyase